MSCSFCKLVGQFTMNVLLALDMCLNTVLMGDPRETVSQRTARARQAGSVGAARFCTVMTWGWRILTFNLGRGDHCDFALAPGTLGHEIWNWDGHTVEVPVAGAIRCARHAVDNGPSA